MRASVSVYLLLFTLSFAFVAPANAQYEEGYASWYSATFHGVETANYEVYDHEALTAAHPTLPFGTMVRVERLDNNRTVTVRVNDRMEPGPNHVIDLSGAAAESLGLLDSGIAKVRLIPSGGAPALASNAPPSVAPAPAYPSTTTTSSNTTYGSTQGNPTSYGTYGNTSTYGNNAATTPSTTTATTANYAGSGQMTLQLGAFSNEQSANQMKHSFPDAWVAQDNSTGSMLYKVYYKRFDSRLSAETERDALRMRGYDSFIKTL